MEELKSVAKLIGNADGILEVDDDWATFYVRYKCWIDPSNGNGYVLGIDFGDSTVERNQFDKCVSQIENQHKSISSIGTAGLVVFCMMRQF